MQLLIDRLVVVVGVGLLLACCSRASYLAGVGMGDITGPAADVNLMGYANPLQTAQGIHIRLFARAFVFADAADPKRRFVYVNIDACMSSQLVTMRVVRRLQDEFGGLYTADNVAISGTHTHASPAGFLQYLLYDITSLGFVRQTFDAMVEGILVAIRTAHRDLRPAQLQLNSGDLLDGSINRSPSAYLKNPAEERALYQHDVDTTMTLLKVVETGPDSGNDAGKGRGLISWFAVHCTSMNNTNRLISGDNKGVAEQLTEDWGRRDGRQFQPNFTAAFAQSSVGDTSPNVGGAFCLDTGEPCDAATSTCNGRNEMCHGRGPAWPDDSASTYIIGERQAVKAEDLYQTAKDELAGPIDYRHTYLDMSHVVVEAGPWTRAGRTCPAAMGMSFAAGTTDGPGALDFHQGDTNGTALWRLVRRFIKEPSLEQQQCHAPKPILLDTGEINFPYAWTPAITEISLLRLGNLLILCVPGELTSMAGRRLKRAVYETVRGAWGDDVQLTISGLTNTYSSYVTTWEEYQAQRYEGAFTLFGPHTLDAYIQEMLKLAQAMIAGRPVTSTVQPPDLYSRQISLLTPVVVDMVPRGAAFGEVTQQPVDQQYRAGQRVVAVFRSGNPRNNLRINGTFLTVELQDRLDPGAWTVVHGDNDWCTRYHWTRPFKLSPQSFATISWDVPPRTPPGTYRLCHYGDTKCVLGTVRPFKGCSNTFHVVESVAAVAPAQIGGEDSISMY